MNVTEIITQKDSIPKRIRLAAYCRVSSDSEDQLHSFAAQIRYYKDYERSRPEYQLIDIYADEGITGTDMAKREEQRRLIRDCKKGLIDRVITKSVSRFARNTQELLTVLRMLKEVGVSVYFEEQDIDTDKLNSEMIVTFPGMAAQQESIGISQNMRWSYRKRMESGDFNCCSPAYGFEMVKGSLAVKEDEARIIRRIFDLYLKGVGKQGIANLLNEEGVPRRYGQTKWYAGTIDYVINNERYMGNALLQKCYRTETLPFKQKINKGELPKYYVENANPPIISKEIYEVAQELQKAKSKNKNPSKILYPLSHTLYCEDCGRVFRRQIVAGKAYWICNAKAKEETRCRSRKIPEETVYEAFERLVFKLHTHLTVLLDPLIRDLEILQRKTSGNGEKIKAIDSQIADLCAKNLVITRLHTSGILVGADYTAQADEINQKISGLRKERRQCLIEDNDNECIESLKELREILEEYEPGDSFDENLYTQIVERVIVGNTTVTFRLIGGIELPEEIIEQGRAAV